MTDLEGKEGKPATSSTEEPTISREQAGAFLQSIAQQQMPSKADPQLEMKRNALEEMKRRASDEMLEQDNEVPEDQLLTPDEEAARDAEAADQGIDPNDPNSDEAMMRIEDAIRAGRQGSRSIK
jgi:hypothetical protein